MELRHLRYFIAVADTGSFTEAANQLCTVQPSLSRQIKDLESYVGTTLFIRGHRQVSLTEAGRVFLDESRLVLAQVERAVERARQVAEGVAPRFVVGFDYGLEHKFLAYVASVLQQPSRAELVVRSLPAPMLLTEIEQGKIDIAFTPPRPEKHDLHYHALGSDPIIAALPCSHPLASQTALNAALLAQKPIITATEKLGPVLHQASLEYGRRNGTAFSIGYEAETLTMAISLMQSMQSVALLPAYSQHLFPKDICVRPLEGDVPQIAYGLVWHKDNHSPILQQVLAQFGANSPEGLNAE